ncbi:BTB/POZ domain-containing protein At5g17580-like [Corylus avellana]|uniref:BTB/POZ domain-containing protein At5g17580-like n=1 Tax=Corylus avellana TaxID=13451 RepID=UPI001E22976E|nr:BTB/POZ domain-containing protein At5g17580-like [Corylus avellana]
MGSGQNNNERNFNKIVSRQSTGVPPWLSKSTSPLHVHLLVGDVPFTLDRELLAARSAKIAALIRVNSQEDLSHSLGDIPPEPKTFELVARFCYGLEVHMSSKNVVPLICFAHYLMMTENHSRNNLLSKALAFFEKRVLPSWNETIKALRTMENIFQEAVNFGLVDACSESIIDKALVDPSLLGEPIKDDENVYRPNARRRLFDPEGQPDDLTMLPLQLYEPIMLEMSKRGAPSMYVAASLCTYARKWVFPMSKGSEKMSTNERNSSGEVIEAVEMLLSHERGLLPCNLLFDMLQSAIILGANPHCIYGFEARIGKQLEEATAKDLLIPCQFDTECVRRILKIFYGNYTSSDISGLITVAELLEDFLAMAASEKDLKLEAFVSLGEISSAASLGAQRSSDGIYRAVDIYLDQHRYLTESEREEVCRVLECQKMSLEACEHAAKNERLPLRVVVQVLFAGKLQLNDTITKDSDDRLGKEEAAGNEDVAKVDCGGQQVRSEMKNMCSKVMGLERECHMMRKEIGSGSSRNVKKEKVSMWRDMKRKFGCISHDMHDLNCQTKKKNM